MRSLLPFLFAAAVLAPAPAPVQAQENEQGDEPSVMSLQVWTDTQFSTDSIPDFLGRVSFGPVFHLSAHHAIGLHANFLDAILGSEDGGPVVTTGYTYSHGPISVGAGVTFANDDDDGWSSDPGLSLGWQNLSLWLSGDRGSLGVAVPLF